MQRLNHGLSLKEKSLINDLEIIIMYWEEFEQSELLASKCGLFQKTAWRFGGGGSSETPRKLSPHLSRQSVFPPLFT